MAGPAGFEPATSGSLHKGVPKAGSLSILTYGPDKSSLAIVESNNLLWRVIPRSSLSFQGNGRAPPIGGALKRLWGASSNREGDIDRLSDCKVRVHHVVYPEERVEIQSYSYRK